MRICENEFVSPSLDLTLQTYDCESEIDNTFHKKYLVQRAGKEKEENLNNIINMGIIVKGAVSSKTKIGFV